MTVYAKVVVNNIQQSNAGNLLAAFDKNGVAGAVAPIPENNGVFALTIWQDANAKEPIDLKFYDNLTGKIYFLSEEIEFATNSQVGELEAPLELVPLYEEVELALDVQKGWNWISFGVLPARASIARIFGDYLFSDNDLIKGDGAFATYFQGQWYPEDFTLESGRMYSLRRQAEGTASVSVIGGEQVATEAIPLVSGWNWLGFTPGTPKLVGEALAGLDATNGDLIKGQTLGSVTYNNGNWVPGNAQLLPGCGYMLRVSKKQNFRYEAPVLAASNGAAERAPAVPNFNRNAVVLKTNATPAKLGTTTAPDWAAPVGKANNMVVFAGVKIDGETLGAEGSRLAAFEQDQLAGVVEIQDGPSGQYFPLQVFTDSADGATISFKVYDVGAGKVFDLKETVPFQAEGIIAGIDEPMALTYTTAKPSVTSVTINGTVGISLTANIMAINSPTNYELVSGSWPAGLSLNASTGILSGIPTKAGSSSVTVAATNAGGNGTGALTINIAKGSQTISGVAPTQTKEAESVAYSLNATVSSSLTLSYESSNTSVAAVAANGTVTVVGAGTTTLTVSQAGDANYNAATGVTQILTVTSAVVVPPPGGGGASAGGGAPAQVQKSKKGGNKGKSSSAKKSSGGSTKSSAIKSSGGSSKESKGSKSSSKKKSGGSKKSKK